MLAFRLDNLTVSMTVSQSQAEQVQSFLIAGAHPSFSYWRVSLSASQGYPRILNLGWVSLAGQCLVIYLLIFINIIFNYYYYKY